ncbi:MAG: hypothetical protein ACREQ5_17240 [Candidatus Dormibacteria bacterium]
MSILDNYMSTDNSSTPSNPLDAYMQSNDSSGPSQLSNPLEAYMPKDQSSSQLTTGQPNSTPNMSGYIASQASNFGLDPNAVLGVASNEGMSGGVGDNGTSFGPFQLHAGGALPQQIWSQGADYAQKWAWSPEGIDYALQKMADNGAKGLKGRQAVESIVYNFERPANPTADLNAGYNAVGGQ